MRFVNYSVFYKDLKAHGLEYAARHTRELGFEAVEFLDIVPLRETSPLNRYTPEEVTRVLRENHLTVSCFSVGVTLDTSEKCEQLLRVVDYAAKIGSPRFHHTVMSKMNPEDAMTPYEDVFATVSPFVARVAARCQSLGMACLYEPQGFFFNGVKGLGRLFDAMKADRTNVGICGDVANGLFVEASAESIFDAFADAIKHVHVKDYRVYEAPVAGTEGYLTKGGNYVYDCPIGEGVTNLRYCLKKLQEVNYKGDIALEILGDDREILQAMSYLKNLMKEVWKDEV